MINRRKLTTLIALILAIGLFSAASVTGSAGSTLILDNFVEATATEISLHEPDTAPKNSSWFTEGGAGVWEVENGAAQEVSEHTIGNPDNFALINSKSSNVAVIIDVQRNTLTGTTNTQLWGAVARYSAPNDLIFVFYDGVSEFVLGKKRPDEDERNRTEPDEEENFGNLGGFQELGRVLANFSGSTAKLKLEISGDSIKVFLDEDPNPIMIAIDDDNMKSGNVGLFSLGNGNANFDQIIVSQVGSKGKGGGKGKDPGKKGKK